MPYNNTTIPPPEEITGTSSLPLARVKKIIAQDEDIAQCSNGAAFAISVATEIFIRYLTEQAHNVVKAERKPRRNLQYKDFANAVSRIDNLEFLSDTIPKTTTYRKFKEMKARAENTTAATTSVSSPGTMPAGPATVGDRVDDSHTFARSNGTAEIGSPKDMSDMVSISKLTSINGSPMADRTVLSSTQEQPSRRTDEDTEMEDEPTT